MAAGEGTKTGERKRGVEEPNLTRTSHEPELQEASTEEGARRKGGKKETRGEERGERRGKEGARPSNRGKDKEDGKKAKSSRIGERGR